MRWEVSPAAAPFNSCLLDVASSPCLPPADCVVGAVDAAIALDSLTEISAGNMKNLSANAAASAVPRDHDMKSPDLKS